MNGLKPRVNRHFQTQLSKTRTGSDFQIWNQNLNYYFQYQTQGSNFLGNGIHSKFSRRTRTRGFHPGSQ